MLGDLSGTTCQVCLAGKKNRKPRNLPREGTVRNGSMVCTVEWSEKQNKTKQNIYIYIF